MTDYDEHFKDMTFPEREVVDIDMNWIDDQHDTLPALIDVHFRGQHVVIAPFAMEGDFTVDVALFDAEGNQCARRLLSVMSGDIPFVLGGEP